MVNLSTELLVLIGSDLQKDVWLSVGTTICHKIFGTATYSSHLGPCLTAWEGHTLRPIHSSDSRKP